MITGNSRRRISDRFGLPCSAVVSLACLFSASVSDAQQVIHISVDGLRSDVLQWEVETFPESYPNLVRLIVEGVSTFNARTDFTHTVTLPNHVTMVTGRPVFRPNGAPETTHHGWGLNAFPGAGSTLHNFTFMIGNPSVSYVASTFDVAHDNGLSTALYSGKEKFSLFDSSYDAENGAIDLVGHDNGRDKIDTYVRQAPGPVVNGTTLTEAFVGELADKQTNYTFLHYLDLDFDGHAAGWGSARWLGGLKRIDGYLGRIFEVVEGNAGLQDDTTIILTGDHGGRGNFHSDATDPANYTVPVFVWGDGIAEGIDLYHLNSTTRLDPGFGRPDYNAAVQPIRNGDTGNLALSLLGLGSIPGSTINNSQDLRVTLRLGDFDRDGDVDADDIDFYSGKIGQTANGVLTMLDLDGDGSITLLDHDQHVTTYVQTSDGQVGARIGDLNLDGRVDVLSDAFALIQHLSTFDSFSYRLGDLNADQKIDVLGDAFRLVGNLGLSNSLEATTSTGP